MLQERNTMKYTKVKNTFNSSPRKRELLSLWGKVIKARDRYTCQQCGERNGLLDPHHIIRKSKGNTPKFDIQNGVTLCRSCHSKFHRFGYEVEYVRWLDFWLNKQDMTFEQLKETYRGAYQNFTKDYFETKKKVLEDILLTFRESEEL